MRRVVLIALLVGCSDEPESRPPVESLKPGGTGWECFRERIGDLSICDRPGACETRRRAMATELDRSGTPYEMTACIGRSRVACFTAQLVVSTKNVYVCSETMTECNKFNGLAKQSADYRDVSDCGSW